MRRALLPVGALAVGLAAGVIVGPILTADASVTPILAGQYCTPHGGVYRTTTTTMLCAQSISPTRVVDPAWRWRNITTPACPVGYARQILHIQALPRGETKVRSVTVLDCVLTATSATTALPSPSPIPVASGAVSPSPAGASPSPSPPG